MRKITALLAALTLGLVATGCGGDDTSTDSAATSSAAAAAADHNDADVDFAQGMIPHHAQAVEMADMAVEASVNVQVLSLAKRIQAAQQPEIEQMTGWLDAWGEPVAADPGEHSMGGHAMGGGMMGEAEMSQLGTARGAAFDRVWLDMMIRHHEGAIEMAETHQREGEYPDALVLGAQIISAQQAEINEMRSISV